MRLAKNVSDLEQRTIKKKLATISGANAGGGTAGDGDVTATTKATPKRKKAVGEDGGTPAKVWLSLNMVGLRRD